MRAVLSMYYKGKMVSHGSLLTLSPLLSKNKTLLAKRLAFVNVASCCYHLKKTHHLPSKLCSCSVIEFSNPLRGLFVCRRVKKKKKPPQCCLLFSLVQKALGAVRSLTPTSSPLSSPSKHGDRFIPSRAGANWSVNFHRINVSLPQQQIHQALFCLSYQKNNALKIKVFALFFLILKFTELVESDHLLIMIILTQEIEKSHNQNRKTKDGTTDSNKGNPLLFS